MKSIGLILIIFTLASQSFAEQILGENHISVVSGGKATYAPLLLYTSGSGAIIPFKAGEMLKVGGRYLMLAVPERGSVFENWQQVNVFTVTTITTNEFGVAVPITSTITSPQPAYTKDHLLNFVMQPQAVITETPLLTITSAIGWQANFAARNNR
jgi:hypothetical protein